MLEQLIFGSEFNKQLSNSLDNLIMLEQLTFGHKFNKSLSNSLDNLIMLEKLTFGHRFNKPLANSLDNLISLQQLSLCSFNQELNIPSNIHILNLDIVNINLIEYLTNNIEELNLGWNFNLELNNLPNSIKIIRFDIDSNYNSELNNLPKSLEILELPKKYNNKIINLSTNCIVIKQNIDPFYKNLKSNNIYKYIIIL
jgi:hypothetical protein